MEGNLLIIGAGTYAQVAAEIAADMGVFLQMAFVDDKAKTLLDGTPVVGTTQDIDRLAGEYSAIIVAIGNPKVRLSLLEKIKEKFPDRIISLISPRAYVSPTAKIMPGCIIEPMAVVQSNATIGDGTMIASGAVIKHNAVVGNGCYVDCNSTVLAGAIVPNGEKVFANTVVEGRK